jgi:AraC-like DNA-binding protein
MNSKPSGRSRYSYPTQRIGERCASRNFLWSTPATPVVAKLCKVAGLSKRTVERLFQENTATTFGSWRQQLRLMRAMRLLAEGAKVTFVALEVGYSTPSAFIAMFRKTLGTTPMAYFHSSSQNP